MTFTQTKWGYPELYQELKNYIEKSGSILIVNLKDDDSIIISLKTKYQPDNFYVGRLIERVQLLFIEYCATEKVRAKENSIELSSSFKLQLKTDFITKGEISNPIICLKSDKLMFNPEFCDQRIFFQEIVYNRRQVENINLRELQLTLLFWEIINTLQLLYAPRKFNIYIHPLCSTFTITEQINKKEILYFHDDKSKWQFFYINSIFINQKYYNMCKYFEMLSEKYSFENLFDFHSSEEVLQNGKLINISLKQNEIDQFDEIIVEKQKNRFNIHEDNVQVQPNKFSYIHSTLCSPSTVADYHKHKIQFPADGYPQCEYCKVQIDQDNYDSLYIDENFKRAHDDLISRILLDNSLLPLVFYMPIHFKLITDNYHNTYIEYYINKKNGEQYILYKQGYRVMYYNAEIYPSQKQCEISQKQEQFQPSSEKPKQILKQSDSIISEIENPSAINSQIATIDSTSYNYNFEQKDEIDEIDEIEEQYEDN